MYLKYFIIINFLIYFITLLWYLKGLIKISRPQKFSNYNSRLDVSVIICVKNGEESLHNILHDLKVQKYSGKHEFIIVDDYSVDTVVITGGEPLMWNLDKLTSSLKNEGLKVHLETSGAHPLSGSFDWICFSPKKIQTPLNEIKSLANELKIIINNKNDFDWGEQQRKDLNDNCKLYLQAEWSKREEIIPLIIDFVKENKDWTISLQSHKYMNIS